MLSRENMLDSTESGKTPPVAAPFRLENMGEGALLDLRAQIDAALPSKCLKDLDLETELVIQLQTAKQLQNEVLNDDGVPANQKAQVLNACASSIESLIRMQEKYHTGERLKQIETHLIDVLNRLPLETTTQFFEWYEQYGS